jgi:hypothetical protein
VNLILALIVVSSLSLGSGIGILIGFTISRNGYEHEQQARDTEIASLHEIYALYTHGDD